MRRALSPCAVHGCAEFAMEHGRCREHAAQLVARYEQTRPDAVERGYGGEWLKLRKEFLSEYPDCAICGAPATDVDHIIPRVRGGSDDVDNLESLCHACHSRKTARFENHWGRHG